MKKNTFIIKNSFELLNHLKKLENITGLYTYDFEDLYNSIDLTDLKNKLMVFYENYNANDTDIAYFTDLFNFVVFENYLYEGNKVFRQVKGIPMGGSCSSILADIYLFMYEGGLQLQKDLHLYRYIDDILYVKTNNIQNECVFDFYPTSLILKYTSNSHQKVNYLDTFLELDREGLGTGVYDKRNSFSVDTVKMLNFQSNVHISILRNIFANGLNRIERLTSSSEGLVGEMFEFYAIASSQGYPPRFINDLIYDFSKGKSYRYELYSMFDSRGVSLGYVGN